LHRHWCTRHLAQNLLDTYKDKKFEEVARQLEEQFFEQKLNEIKMATNDAGRRWLRGLMREREKWSWAYDAGGWRYEFQTSNMADSFNNVLKGIRAMPINVIVSFSPSTGWLHGSMTDTHKQ
jgi:hypothetical protein